MSGHRGALAMAVGLSLFAILAGPAAGDDRGHHRPRGWHGHIERFHEHDLGRWARGRWHHGRHDGRVGWWWVVGGVRYFYPTRVLPYPDPYQPPVVVPPPPVPPQYWYYCARPAGYYPYVAHCATRWEPVPATPPAAMPPR